jgi:hypothetical protein
VFGLGRQASLAPAATLRSAAVTGLALPSSPSLRCSMSSPGSAALRQSCPPQLLRATATCRRRQPLAYYTPALRYGSVIRCQGPLLQSASFLGLLLQRCLPHGGMVADGKPSFSTLRSSSWPSLRYGQASSLRSVHAGFPARATLTRMSDRF